MSVSGKKHGSGYCEVVTAGGCDDPTNLGLVRWLGSGLMGCRGAFVAHLGVWPSWLTNDADENCVDCCWDCWKNWLIRC